MKPLLLAASFIAGLFAADSLLPSAETALAAGVGGATCLVAAWVLHRRVSDPGEGDLLPQLGRGSAVAVLLGIALLGFADLGARAAQTRASPLPSLDGRVVLLGGRLTTDPRPVGGSWIFTLGSIVDEGGVPLPGRLAVRSYGKAPPVQVGDRVQVEVKVSALDPADPFDISQARRGNAAEASLVAPVRVAGGSTNPLVGTANFFRGRMRSGAELALPRNQAALLLGLTIGDDRMLSARVRDDFRASGLSHLTAVSGANVAIVLGAFAALLSGLGLSQRTKIACGLGAILLFAVVTRWEPSVLRASVMAAIALAAFLFGRKSSSLHVLAIAFLGLLMFDPMLLWSVGFQLSFAATAGILTLREPLAERLRLLPRWVAEPVAIGLAAQAAVFPLIAIHFDKVSVASLPANLVGAGLVAPATVLGLTAGVLSMPAPPLARPAFLLAGLPTAALEKVAATFGRSELSQIAVPHFGFFEFLAAVLGLVAASLCLLHRRNPWRWAALGAVVLVVGALAAPAARSQPSGLRVTFFDVGQGDSALIESPAGARVLIDGGPDPELVADSLRRLGINRIDLVVASHMHADHVTGLGAVLERFVIRLALHPGVAVPLLESLAARSRLQPVGAGEKLAIGDLTIDVLGPAPEARQAAVEAASLPDSPKEGAELNDASVVLRANWGRECVLFTGDLEEAGQQLLLESHGDDIDCTVLKAPHHGSGRLLEAFVEAVDPEWVLVSVGRNDYGHPTSKSLGIFEDAGAEVLRTDRLDDITVEIDGAGRVEVRR